MSAVSRRSFVQGAVASVALSPLLGNTAMGLPLRLPLGLQLYSVRQQMAENFPEALSVVRAAGFTEVEAATLPKVSAAEVRAAFDRAGLRCVSAHHSFTDFADRLDEIVAYNKTLGVRFLICPVPGYKNASAAAGSGTRPALTLEDWRYNAERFNEFGTKLKAVGMRFGYHNHTREFEPMEGTTPYAELLRLTDPSLVTFELDCGWAIVAGVAPETLMQRYPRRFAMLHVKDFKLSGVPEYETHDDAKVTELGQGSIHYGPIFNAAAKTQDIEHAFVEQEAYDMPVPQALKIDADYLRKLES